MLIFRGVNIFINNSWPVALQVPKLFGSQLLIGNPRRLGEVRVVVVPVGDMILRVGDYVLVTTFMIMMLI